MTLNEDHWFNPNAEVSSDHAKVLFEQYKLYVETTSKVTEWRSAANTFLLGANTALVTLYGLVAGKDLPLARAGEAWRWLAPLAGILACLTWYTLMRSYRNLNTAKFAVIHAIERRLPVRLFDFEWEHLQRGRTWAHVPLTHVEQAMPLIFGLIYGGMLVFIALPG